MPRIHNQIAVPSRLLDIIIVNWNSRSQLAACLKSLFQASLPENVSIVVVDNSFEIKDLNYVPGTPSVALLNPDKNLGFGGGCNLGATQGQAPFILFLNPDIIFPLESVQQLMAYLQSGKMSDNIGILGVQLHNPDGSIQKNVARFPRFSELFPRMAGFDRLFPGIFKPHYAKDLDYTINQVVEQVPGAFFLVRRSCFEQLGGFDERFFMYYEDVDFSYRAHQVGWKTQYLADVKVFHGGGGTTEIIKDKRLFYSLRSRVLYVGKHFGRWQALAVLIATLTIELFSRCARAVLRLSSNELAATLKGYNLLIFSLPEILREL